MNKPSTNELNADVAALVELMARTTEGQVLTWQELNAAVPGKRVNGRHAYLLNSARKHLLNDCNAVFDSVRGVGVKRCDDLLKVSGVGAQSKKIRRAIRRGIRRLEAVDHFESLPQNVRQEHQIKQSVFKMQEHLMKRAQITKIEQRVSQAQASLSPQVALSLFQTKAAR